MHFFFLWKEPQETMLFYLWGGKTGYERNEILPSRFVSWESIGRPLKFLLWIYIINNFLKFGIKSFIIMLWPLSSGCTFQNMLCAKQQDSFVHFSFNVSKMWTFSVEGTGGTLLEEEAFLPFSGAGGWGGEGGGNRGCMLKLTPVRAQSTIPP